MMTWNKISIRKLRKDLRLTQVEFSMRLGCRQQTVSEWEQGIYEPANAYCKLLNFLEKESEHERSASGASAGSLHKKISSFTLPSIEVPDVFLDEINSEAIESESRVRPFDPAID